MTTTILNSNKNYLFCFVKSHLTAIFFDRFAVYGWGDTATQCNPITTDWVNKRVAVAISRKSHQISSYFTQHKNGKADCTSECKKANFRYKNVRSITASAIYHRILTRLPTGTPFKVVVLIMKLNLNEIHAMNFLFQIQLTSINF